MITDRESVPPVIQDNIYHPHHSYYQFSLHIRRYRSTTSSRSTFHLPHRAHKNHTPNSSLFSETFN